MQIYANPIMFLVWSILFIFWHLVLFFEFQFIFRDFIVEFNLTTTDILSHTIENFILPYRFTVLGVKVQSLRGQDVKHVRSNRC